MGDDRPIDTLTFHVTVPESDVDLAADRLWQLGVDAVGLTEPVHGRVELWTSVGSSVEAIERAASVLDPHWTWRTEAVTEPATTWREHVGPTWYGPKGILVPAWQDPPPVDDGVLVTCIEPAASFGLGDHPTTAATAHLLAAHLDDADVGSLLDVGCGSGVLGIIAAQRGVGRVRAVDVSAAAIEATVANARRNGVSSRVEADLARVADLRGRYDVVVANILAPVLVALAGDLRRLLADDGLLIVSGILEMSHGHVLDAVSPLREVARHSIDGWVAIALRGGDGSPN